MTHRIRRFSAARADLLEIWLARAEYDEQAADRLLDEFEQAFARIAQFPQIGFRRDALAEGVRLLLRSPFLIAYRIAAGNEDVIEVLRVIDGRRDLVAMSGPN